MAEQSIDDPFRDEIPLREPVSVSKLIGDLLRPRDEGDDLQPDPKEMRCGICHKNFMAKAGWFAAKWLHASVCANCADGNKLPPGFLAECPRAPIREIGCPKCGIRRGIEPVLRNNVWNYEMTCAQCGCYTVQLYRIKRLCAQCQEEFVVREQRPRRYCAKCDKDHKTAYT